MPFQKGHKKIGGRKAETPNKVKKDLRTRISMFLEDNFDEAINTWKGIKEPKEKIKLYVDLMKFGIPTLQAVSLDATITQENSVEDDLKELSKENE